MTYSSDFERCKLITDELISQPLNQYFTVIDPKKDGLVDYFDIITQPMDFSTIQSKFKSNKYGNEYEWYKDVCLIYENAMKYHPSDSIYHKIAEYCSKQFKKRTTGFEFTESSQQEWFNAVCRQMQKLAEAVSKSPVPQGVDPLIISIIEKSKTLTPPPILIIPDIVNKINKLMKDDKCREEIVYILRQLQPSLQFESDDITINLNSLAQSSLNAIYLYSRAH
ncbi:hypothetical protein M9Y10_033434 [Tritrichomonas musculus]|uniref:Bromo domain-containing protein n=1 Tax=Tritrichomonas musculus TaxID=1915356 RepID=A0ABR2KC42_9EUKA